MTVCVNQVALVGPTRRSGAPASAPDVWMVWDPMDDGTRVPATLYYGYTRDACRVTYNVCIMRPLIDVAESTIQIGDGDPDFVATGDIQPELSPHWLGTTDEVIANLDTVFEVEPAAYGTFSPPPFETRVWVSVAYP